VSECSSPRAEWVWCDDFEQDRLAQYFEYDSAGGAFTRTSGVGVGGSVGMRARFATGQTSVGSLHLALGKTPQGYFRAVDQGQVPRRELYWRLYLKNQPGWTGGGGDKLSRALSFASPTSWAEAMIAHVWSGMGADANFLLLDPASGTDTLGVLQTVQYNDWQHMRWLGQSRSAMPLFDSNHVGQWYCIESHVRLNDPGQSNGVFELWLDGTSQARRTGLNWVGAFTAYGINAVYVENYWNAGSPQAQERYIDNFVVSTQPIGCSATK